jgi:hypothetical protein
MIQADKYLIPSRKAVAKGDEFTSDKNPVLSDSYPPVSLSKALAPGFSV